VQVVATIRTRSFTQLQRVVLRSTSHGSVFPLWKLRGGSLVRLLAACGAPPWRDGWLTVGDLQHCRCALLSATLTVMMHPLGPIAMTGTLLPRPVGGCGGGARGHLRTAGRPSYRAGRGTRPATGCEG
jgi:hypothetical protein